MQIPPNPSLSQTYRSPEPGEDGGGTVPPPAGAAADPQVTTNTPDAAATPADTGPKDMLSAMFGQKQEPAAPTEEEVAAATAKGQTVQQLRDERGRFAGKAPADATTPPPEAKKPADPTAMPEGLTPKAQERFQTLVNTNKELTAQLSGITQAAGSLERAGAIIENALAMQETFQQNGVRREQFDQAMQAVGMINRGDLEGALRVLDDQRRLISLALGRPIPGADALATFPDLRQAVDNLQITEEHALEIARGRTVQHHTQQTSQRQQFEQRQEQQAEEAKQQGQLAVDKFCKARMADDMDYAAIEPMLLKEIQGGLLQGVPPQQWARIVEKTYGLIKQTASATRQSAPSTPVLRPTGGESPRQAPKTMHEAMWGSR